MKGSTKKAFDIVMKLFTLSLVISANILMWSTTLQLGMAKYILGWFGSVIIVGFLLIMYLIFDRKKAK